MSRDYMIHAVFGYPDQETSKELIQFLDQSGVKFIEIQIPFSDPLTDGPILTAANQSASKNTNADDTLTFLKNIRFLHSKVMVMCYFQTVFSYGIKAFCEELASANVTGLIVPDLPYDELEYRELIDELKKYKVEYVPVLSPNVSLIRLNKYLAASAKYVYLTARTGVTGEATVGAQLRSLSDIATHIKSISKSTLIMVGFGISTPEHVSQLPKIIDVAVIGSAVTKELEKASLDGTKRYITKLTKK